MANPHCPRCDRPLRTAAVVHWSCFLARARLLLGGVTGGVVAIVLIVVLALALRPH